MLKGAGFTDADLERPLVGVANTWTEVMPCNVHLRALAERVKAGMRAAGGTPIEFNTIAVSDGITMGTDGHARLAGVARGDRRLDRAVRDVAHRSTAWSRSSGCDKTIPATVMALARLDVPGLVLYGGPIAPGRFEGKDVTIQDVFEAVGAHAAGKMSSQRLARARGQGVSRRGRVRRAVHREHDGVALTLLGLSPMGANEVAGDRSRRSTTSRASAARS